MSKQFDIKNRILHLMENPTDRECAERLLLDAIDSDESDFEFDNDETVTSYLFGDID